MFPGLTEMEQWEKIMNAGNCCPVTVSIWASPLPLSVIALKGG